MACKESQKHKPVVKLLTLKSPTYFRMFYLVFWSLFNVFTGWNVLLLVQIKDFLLIPSKIHYHLKKNKTKNESKRKIVRSLSQTKAGKKKNQRNAEFIHTHPAFSPEGESATLLQGTGTGTSTPRISMKSDQANDEERRVTNVCCYKTGMSLGVRLQGSLFFRKGCCSKLNFEPSCLCEK